MTDDRTLRMERTFQAPAEAVFEAWTSEEVLRRWWHTEHGYETSAAEVGYHAAFPYSSWRFHHWYGGVCG